MKTNLIPLFLVFLFALSTSKAQEKSDPLDFVNLELNKIQNDTYLGGFFNKLKHLEETDSTSLNILHIGDSHIQAGFITEVLRTNFQEAFGNAGRGFVFPYKMAKTNGPFDVKFSSPFEFTSIRNVKNKNNVARVGLSGIGFYADSPNTFIKVSLKDSVNYTKHIEIISSNNSWEVLSDISYEKPIAAWNYYTVKSGDVLGKIARKYNVSLKNLKKWNHLSSNMIRPKQKLKIKSSGYRPGKIHSKTQMNASNPSNYYSDSLISEFYISPNSDFKKTISIGWNYFKK